MHLDPTVIARGLVKHWNYFSHHIIASPGMAHPMQALFEEAYVVMGAARTMALLDDARMTAICRRFNGRMMEYQGVHYPDMFDMGYGYNRDARGMVSCSCVADNASTANGMLEGVVISRTCRKIPPCSPASGATWTIACSIFPRPGA
jgi:hypothetical protein